MTELKNIKNKVEPQEILLVVDAMTGQDAVNVAKSFNDLLEISGVILTKLDGDTRGGAALSVRAVTGKPIKLDVYKRQVLVCAFFSVVVGAVILWQPDAFARIFRFFLDKPWMLAITLAATALIAVYVAKGPLWIGRAFARWAGKVRKR